MQGCSNGLWDNRYSLLIHLSGIEADGAPTSQTLLDARPKRPRPESHLLQPGSNTCHLCSSVSACHTIPSAAGGARKCRSVCAWKVASSINDHHTGDNCQMEKKLFTVNLFKRWNVLPWAYIACTQTKGINVLLQELANIQGKHKLQVACRDQKRHQVRGWRDPCKRERSGKAQAL